MNKQIKLCINQYFLCLIYKTHEETDIHSSRSMQIDPANICIKGRYIGQGSQAVKKVMIRYLLFCQYHRNYCICARFPYQIGIIRQIWTRCDIDNNVLFDFSFLAASILIEVSASFICFEMLNMLSLLSQLLLHALCTIMYYCSLKRRILFLFILS